MSQLLQSCDKVTLLVSPGFQSKLWVGIRERFQRKTESNVQTPGLGRKPQGYFESRIAARDNGRQLFVSRVFRPLTRAPT